MSNVKLSHALSPLCLAAITLLVSGCAPKLSQQECLTNNMYEMGLADGNAGKSMNVFTKYQTDCNEYHVQLDQKSFQQGWAEGNRSYCQPTTAFTLGKNGQPYPVVCTDYNTTALRNEYNRGVQVFQRIRLIEQQIADIDNQMNQAAHIQAEIDSVSDQLARLHEQRDSAKDKRDRRSYDYDIDSLRSRLDTLRGQLIAAQTVDMMKHAEYQQKEDALYQELDRLKATQ